MLTVSHNHRWRALVLATVYGSPAVATGNWVSIALSPEDPYYLNEIQHGLLRAAATGSVLFVAAALLAFYRLRLAVVAGLSASVLSWPYFGYLAAELPWRVLGWLVRIHFNGAAQVTAVLSLAVATVYSLAEAWMVQTFRSTVGAKS